MLRRLATLSILAIAGTFSVASVAKAETVDVPFTGTLSPQCSFGTPTPGNITFSDSKTFSSTTAGSVSVTCNTASATLQVTDVAYSAGATTSGYTLSASAAVTPGTATYTDGSSDGAEIIGVGTYTATVSMSGSNSAVMTAGNYTFDVTLEALPN